MRLAQMCHALGVASGGVPWSTVSWVVKYFSLYLQSFRYLLAFFQRPPSFMPLKPAKRSLFKGAFPY